MSSSSGYIHTRSEVVECPGGRNTISVHSLCTGSVVPSAHFGLDSPKGSRRIAAPMRAPSHRCPRRQVRNWTLPTRPWPMQPNSDVLAEQCPLAGPSAPAVLRLRSRWRFSAPACARRLEVGYRDQRAPLLHSHARVLLVREPEDGPRRSHAPATQKSVFVGASVRRCRIVTPAGVLARASEDGCSASVRSPFSISVSGARVRRGCAPTPARVLVREPEDGCSASVRSPSRISVSGARVRRGCAPTPARVLVREPEDGCSASVRSPPEYRSAAPACAAAAHLRQRASWSASQRTVAAPARARRPEYRSVAPACAAAAHLRQRASWSASQRTVAAPACARRSEYQSVAPACAAAAHLRQRAFWSASQKTAAERVSWSADQIIVQVAGVHPPYPPVSDARSA
ncbi:hypothetical protein FB451DRAFT_1379941 [Mycena latifolia]|nr:hypothetical protein FB451DRAFT_1379941 [Mycena latifolia]